MNNKELIELFLNTYRVDNKSENTIKTYGIVLSKFDTFIDNSFSGLSLIDIDKYKMHNSKVASSTQNLHIICIRSFMKFLYKRKIVTDNFYGDIEMVKVAKKIKDVQYMTEDHQRIFIQYLKNMSDRKVVLRKKLMFLLYISTGMRKSELINLRLKDIKKKDGSYILLVRGKGNKERLVWLNAIVVDLLLTYLEKYAKDNKEYLFESAHGNRIDPSNVNKSLNVILKNLNFPHYTVHQLRHACASMMFESGAKPEEVQMALGHSSVVTTQNIYIHTRDGNRQYEAFKKNKMFIEKEVVDEDIEE